MQSDKKKYRGRESAVTQTHRQTVTHKQTGNPTDK